MCSLALLRICIALLGAASGALFIGMAISYYRDQSDMAELFKDCGIPHPKVAILSLGIVIFVMSIVSLVTAFNKTIVGKIIYCLILGLMIAFLVTVAVMIFAKRRDFLEQSGQMFDSIWNYREKPSAARFLDKVNQYFHCCGSKSPNDYNGMAPASCCNAPIDNVCDINSLYQNGCRKCVINYTAAKADLIGSINIVTAVVLIIVVISSFI